MEQVLAKRAPEPDAVNWDKARHVALDARGIPIPVSPDSPDLAELLTTAPRVPSIPPWTPLHDEDDRTHLIPVQAADTSG
jgi:L,D-transpeptidase ErfK/SrfK